MRITESALRRIVRQELREMKGVTMSVEDEVAEYIRTHFVPGKPLVLPAHLARRVAGPSISGMEGPGAQAAMKVREPQIRGFKRLEDIELNEPEEEEYLPEMRTPLSPRFYAAKRAMGGYPEMSAEELEGAELERYPLERRNPLMFTGTEADNVARFNDEISSKLPMKGSMFKPLMGSVKADDFVGTFEIKRVPGEPELFEASVMRGEDPDTEAGVASADTPYEAVMNAVENASYGRGSPFYGSF